MKEPGRLQSMDYKQLDMTEQRITHTHKIGTTGFYTLLDLHLSLKSCTENGFSGKLCTVVNLAALLILFL